ncbi:MAG: methionine synthase [Clostridia bacterium]
MTLCLPAPNLEEVLRYAGCGAMTDAHLRACAWQAASQIQAIAAPRAVFLCDTPLDDMTLSQTGVTLQGAQIRAHLAGCSRCILLAVTLGAAVDACIRRAQVVDVLQAVLLDAAASAAIEQACEVAQTQALQRENDFFATTRFSPGYGDFPLAHQADFVRLLDAQRRIGMTTTAFNVLTPRKSITAVIGLSHFPSAHAPHCAQCNRQSTCPYRKEGVPCDASRNTDATRMASPGRRHGDDARTGGPPPGRTP